MYMYGVVVERLATYALSKRSEWMHFMYCI